MVQDLLRQRQGADLEDVPRWENPQDWTLRGPQLLTFWIYGQADNSVEPFYVILEDNAGDRETVTLTNFDPTTESWQQLPEFDAPVAAVS